MSSPAGRLVVLTAPSGTGKSSVVQALLRMVPQLVFSGSATTRPARPAEREGIDYRFVSREAFEGLRAREAFVEWAEVHGHLYGTSREAIEEALEDGREILLDIDVQGARQVTDIFPQDLSIFLLPPDYATLEARLRGRGSESEASITTRLRTACGEVRQYTSFQYVVVNDTVEAAADEVRAILIANRAGIDRRRGLAERIVATFPGMDA